MSAQQESPWGRVADDGTVFVRTSEGERSVGQYPEGTPEEALKFFTDRFDALAFEVELLEKRVRGGAMSPDEAAGSVKTVRAQVADAHAVGDLDSLAARLDSLGPVIASQREARKAERAAKVAESKERKDAIVAEAEKLAESNDWRNGANRLRDLLEEWKALPRLDRSTDDSLWRRFSSARTAYTRRRKSHFAEQHEKRDAARGVKEKLATEAESLADSTEWGPTAGRFRDLMRDWKAAGPAPRDVDEALWKRFRGAQDAFFGARDAANAELDMEFAANAEVKEALLVEAEALLPVTDVEAAKRAFRDIADKWDAAGKVPRDKIKPLEARIRKVETAIRGVEDEQWKKSDPEKSARADDMIGKLESAIDEISADLDKARSDGNDKLVKDLEENLASRRAFLDMARKAAQDFSG
ncbi:MULTISPECIES: DUF349 domain-containing protein [unclassified Nocardioides]|uniref:DUF349 domain-containing protein n=1 Tax=unclassified Nocardioides TaxID=2615069 RepID=UPI0006F5B277|nr:MULTISPECIES: DUF349 domain-containing protein [unclassified Nocardioides]KQY64221.1 DNA repair protein [Nocardioides sp. Root140]KQZ70141.1 DNA repair protein [Nocardioides sp. Root151]